MTVALGVMQVPAPVDGDSIRRYETGTLSDGGLWTALRRLSDHTHTGGLNGAPISVSSIPDGSITVGKLDPSVLLPYALVDGSKPFTGQVTMQADAIIRDALYFGEQGTALAPDVTLTRTAPKALRLDSGLTVAQTVAEQYGLIVQNDRARASFQAATDTVIGRVGEEYAGSGMTVSNNLRTTVSSGGWQRDDTAKLGAALAIGSGATLLNLASSAAGSGNAPATLINRLQLSPTGTLTLTPDAGQPALTWGQAGTASLTTDSGTGVVGMTGWPGGRLYLGGTAALVGPTTDNAIASGWSDRRWTAVYAVAGTINTSAADAKTDITPLDPADALAAVLATDPVRFTYTAPAPTAVQYELPDDPEQAQEVLYQRLVNGPLMEAARSQAGFVLDDATGQYQTDPLFATGKGQSNAAHTAGILLAALHAINARLTALEGA